MSNQKVPSVPPRRSRQLLVYCEIDPAHMKLRVSREKAKKIVAAHWTCTDCPGRLVVEPGRGERTEEFERRVLKKYDADERGERTQATDEGKPTRDDDSEEKTS